MYRILVFGMTSNYGGVESVIMNYYRNFDKNRLSLDFLCTSKNVAFEKEILKMGGKIFTIHSRHNSPLKYYFELKKFFQQNAEKYDCIWINMNNLVNIDYLYFAKKYGIKRRIIHSHNSSIMERGIKGRLKEIIHNKNKIKVSKYATDFWACSNAAAEWMFPKEVLDKVKIIKDAINVDLYTFNPSIRKKIRIKYNLVNKKVIGNIGRLSYQKNQEFVLDIFNELHKVDRDYKLILIGQGSDEKILKDKVNKLKLKDDVMFTGMQTNVADWYNAFDVFLFPSRFEGLGVVALEAQANGIPVYASKGKIPLNVKINDNFYFLPLSKDKKFWANKIINGNNYREQSGKIKENFIKKGYYLKYAAIKLENVFIKK